MCMYACVCVYAYVYIYVCACVHIHIYKYNMYVCICVCIYVCLCMCVYKCGCVCVYICIYIYIYLWILVICLYFRLWARLVLCSGVSVVLKMKIAAPDKFLVLMRKFWEKKHIHMVTKRRMQCTQTLWRHALSTRKNWIIHINWMRGKKIWEYSKC